MNYTLLNLEHDCTEPGLSGEFHSMDMAVCINQAESFYLKQDVIGFVHRSITSDLIGVEVPREEVAKYDALLPDVIDVLAAISDDTDTGELLRKTLDHWNTQPLLIEIPERNPTYLHSFGYVNPYDGGPVVSAYLTLYETNKTPNGIDYCSSLTYETFDIPTEWLDVHFPGAVNRIHTAQALGHDWKQLLDFAFGSRKPATVAVDLPDTLVSPQA